MSYKAFISYSHTGDDRLAAALQSCLQRFAKPWYRIHALSIFRDRTHLATNSALWSSLESVMVESEFFLLIASPGAAESAGVRREVAAWLEKNSSKNILIVLAAGEIAWNDKTGDFDWVRTDALPEKLRRTFLEEPLYLDLRWTASSEDLSLGNQRFKESIAELAAALHGKSKDRLIGEDLRQQRRAMRLAWSAVVVFAFLALLAGWQTFRATQARKIANQQREIAERNLQEAVHQRQVANGQTQIADEKRREAETQGQIAERRRKEAEVQRRIAEDKTRLALSRQLAVQSRDELDRGIDVGLLLSVEATRTHDTFEARQSLLTALLREPRLRASLPGRQTSFLGFVSTPRSLVSRIGEYIYYWNPSTHRPFGIPLHITGHKNGIQSVALSADGSLLASGGGNILTGEAGELLLWSPYRRQQLFLLGPVRDPVDNLGFSPDSRWLASLVGKGDDTKLLLWDLNRRELHGQPLQLVGSQISSWAFSPDKKTVATGTGPLSWNVTNDIAAAGKSEILLWDIATSRQLGPPLLGHLNTVTALAFSPDGRTLVSGSADNTILIWDVTDKGGGEKRPLGAPLTAHKGFISSLAFDRTGELLASASNDKTIIIWDMTTAQPEQIGILHGHKEGVNEVIFSPDGYELASQGSDSRILLWNMTIRPILAKRIVGNRSPVRALAFSPDGTKLAASGGDSANPKSSRGIMLWDTRTRQRLGPPMLGHHDVVWGLSFSRDGSRLASWAGDGTRLWSVNHRTELGPLPTAEEKALALTITRDARVVARVGKDQHITLWDLISGQPFGLPLSEQRSEPIYAMRFSWDGKMLAIAYERSIQIWNLSTGRLIGQPLDPLSSVFNLAFSPDGKTLASGGVRGDRLFLWDLASGLALKPALLGHEGSISCLEFSPDGRTLASGGDDGRVFLWDVTTRRRFGPPLEGHEGPVLSLDFSPDGTILASGGNDKTVFLWDVSLEAWRDRACRIAGRNLSHIEWQQFLNREPYRKSCPTLPEPEQGKAFDRVWMYGCCAQ